MATNINDFEDMPDFTNVDTQAQPIDFGSFNTESLETTELDEYLFADPRDIKPKEEEKPSPKEEIKEEKPKEDLKKVLDEELFEENTPEDDDPKVEETEDVEDNTFYNLSQELYKLGIFSEDENDEEIKDPEQFKDKFQREKNKGAIDVLESYLSKYGPEHREAFEAIFQKGLNPREYYKREERIESVKNLDITQEINQEKVVREQYKRAGWSETRINKNIQNLKDLGDLEEEAAEAQRLLIEQEEKELQRAIQQEEQNNQQKVRLKQQHDQAIYEVFQNKIKQKEFDGIPLTEKIASETLDYIITDKYQLPSGETLSEFEKDLMELKRPENFEKRAKIALLLKNNLDLSKVKTTAISKQNNELFSSLTQKDKSRRRDNPLNKQDYFKVSV